VLYFIFIFGVSQAWPQPTIDVYVLVIVLVKNVYVFYGSKAMPYLYIVYVWGYHPPPLRCHCHTALKMEVCNQSHGMNLRISLQVWFPRITNKTDTIIWRSKSGAESGGQDIRFIRRKSRIIDNHYNERWAKNFDSTWTHNNSSNNIYWSRPFRE
jgi:hypothetical protein